jgi:hypothetical protein
MVFNTTFNNLQVISWRSDLLVEEIWVPGENHIPVASHWQTYHIILYEYTLPSARFELTTLMVIGTDCTGSCKSNYHMIMTTTASQKNSKKMVPYKTYKVFVDKVSERLLFNSKWAIYHLYHGEKKLHITFDKIALKPAFLVWIL